MQWFMTNERMHAIRGMVNSGAPVFSNDHCAISASSLAPASAARADDTLLSNRVNNSDCDVTGSSLYGGAPAGAISNESFVTTSVSQPVMLAICVASSPIAHDFGCGFQRSLLSGTRSSVFRVLAISWSNSGRSKSVIFMLSRISEEKAKCKLKH